MCDASSDMIRSLVVALATAALYALLAALFLAKPFSSHTLEILSIGVGFFVLDEIRRHRSGPKDPG